MIRYFQKTLWAQLRHSPSLYLLTMVGVSLGVASVISIQIINRSAVAAFEGGVQAVSGEADLSLVGRGPTLAESLYVAVLAQPGVKAAWPLLRSSIALQEDPQYFLDVVGFDFFAPVPLPLNAPEQRLGGEDWLRQVLARPGWIAVSPQVATERGWAVGDSFAVSSGSRRITLTIGALVDFQQSSPLATRRLALMDISQAQHLLGQAGNLRQIDVQVVETASIEQVRQTIETNLGQHLLVLTHEEQRNSSAGLLAAFRLNLTALSLIAVFVGVFLIFSSTQAALVRRRREFGTLRSLGATSGQVMLLLLSEVCLLGGVGTAVGIPLGWWVAQHNVDVVSATLTNIYLLDEIERLTIPRSLWFLGAAVGLGGAVLGGLGPALEMSRRDPVQLLQPFAIHERLGRFARRMALGGATLASVVGLWFWVWGRHWQPGGFVLAFFLMLILPTFTPWLLQQVCGAVAVRGLQWTLSLRNILVRLQTTSFAVSALAVAVSMLISVTLLIGSFRLTLETWIDSTIRADIFVTTHSWARAASDAALEDDVIETLQSLPGVWEVERLRELSVWSGNRRISLVGIATSHPEISQRLPLLRGEPQHAWQQVQQHGACLISEPLARKSGLDVGDTLQVALASGVGRIAIVGVHYDYSSEAGAAMISLSTMQALYGSAPVQNAALYLEPGQDAAPVMDALQQALPGAPLLVRSNQQLRQEVFHIFDQTFAITQILQGMTLLVAVCGIALTLLVLARERMAEFALYGALGGLRSQIFRVFVGEGISLGIFGCVLGTLGGIVLALILIGIINPAYFGWTIRPYWPWQDVLWQWLWILTAATLASLYPALRASRTPIQELSREEI